MILSIKLASVFLPTLLSILSVSKQDVVKKNRISVVVVSGNTTSCELFTTDIVNLSLDTISKAKINVSGKANLEFELSKASFALLGIGNNRVPIYLTPGDELEINVNFSNSGQVTSFKGENAAIDTYLQKNRSTQVRYDKVDGKYSFEVSPERFSVLRDSLRSEYSASLETLVRSNVIKADLISLLAFKNKMSLVFYDQNYYQSNRKLVESNAALFSKVEKHINSIQHDTLALKTNMFEYGLVLNYYLQNSLLPPFSKLYENNDIDSVNLEIPVLSHQKIKASGYPKTVTDYLLAKNLDFWIRIQGLTDNVDSLYKALRQDSSHWEFNSSVDQAYEKLKTIAPGEVAPNIDGLTANDEMLSLSSLRGKIVYVDIWATWCVPCRKEFPSSKKLVKYFKDNKEIVFLFVSVDKDALAWKKLLKDDEIPNGIHIVQSEPGRSEAIYQSYYIYGIPRYLLIGKDGRIIKSNASRPSSKMTISMINKALDK